MIAPASGISQITCACSLSRCFFTPFQQRKFLNNLIRILSLLFGLFSSCMKIISFPYLILPLSPPYVNGKYLQNPFRHQNVTLWHVLSYRKPLCLSLFLSCSVPFHQTVRKSVKAFLSIFPYVFAYF